MARTLLSWRQNSAEKYYIIALSAGPVPTSEPFGATQLVTFSLQRVFLVGFPVSHLFLTQGNAWGRGGVEAPRGLGSWTASKLE